MDSDPTTRAKQREGITLNGKYTINKLLGVGGMAAVYAATHRNNKRCAIKILHAELSQNAEIRQRFLREGYVANTVGHPGAVMVDDDDTAEDGSAYLVMELLEGDTLEGAAHKAGGTLDAATVLALTDQLLAVLGAAHDKGIVHRDIKPENVFLSRGTQVKVLDFGIARLRQSDNNTRATVEGSVMGTPAFMSPEQARGRWEEVDGQSDLWSVGASMFSLLTGEVVHNGATINEALAASITQAARPVRDIAPNLPPAIAEVVDKALRREKVDRYRNTGEMREALRRAHLSVFGTELPTAPIALAGQPAGQRQSFASGGEFGTAPGFGSEPSATAGVTARGTTSPVTATHGSLHPNNRRPLLVGVGLTLVVGLVAIGGYGLWSRYQRASIEPQLGEAATLAPAAAPEASQAPEVAPAGPAASTEPPGPEKEDEPQASPAALAEAVPAKQASTPRKRAAATKKTLAPPARNTPAPPAQPAAPTPAKPKKPFDPFARRD